MPEWQLPAGRSAYPPPFLEPLLRWPTDALDFVGTTVLMMLSGPVVGLLWFHVAPKLSIPKVVAGSEAPFRAQIGADAWFLLLAVLAGVVCAAVVVALRRTGPGTVAGLAVGGAGAAVVADRVGYLAQHGATLHMLRALGIDPAGVSLDAVDFRVRALGVLVAWPLAAVVAHALALAVKARRSGT
ncbi:MAG: hypothetical protein QOJ03_3001 [Frankiaceae bacterium]|nr:hypothetical protein [Frankiaceae bacterium]